jgi:polyphosphate kinase
LKARFDEENNIVWARELEKAGAHVVFGPLNRKTHCKIALVVRKEDSGLRRYIHLGTGNYNASTARIYEDFGFFTSNPAIGADATDLFNTLTGFARYTYRELLIAPDSLRSGLIDHIEREIDLHKQHGHGRLIFKMNALTDPDMIRLLYQASQAGVEIDLIIRGMCCLRPGVPGVSESIRVRSLVGRFLEHSRIYYFGNHGQPDIYLGSADLMERNLNVRVEALFPIESRRLQRALYERVLVPILADTENARVLQPDGSYQHIQPVEGKDAFDSQEWFLTHPLIEDKEETTKGM